MNLFRKHESFDISGFLGSEFVQVDTVCKISSFKYKVVFVVGSGISAVQCLNQFTIHIEHFKCNVRFERYGKVDSRSKSSRVRPCRQNNTWLFYLSNLVEVLILFVAWLNSDDLYCSS